jgi:hypothetical protein
MNTRPEASDERNFAFLRVMIFLNFVFVIFFFLVRLGQVSHAGFLYGCRDLLHGWEIMTRILILFSGVVIFCWAAVIYVGNQRSFRQDLGHYIAAGCALIASIALQFLNFPAMPRLH